MSKEDLKPAWTPVLQPEPEKKRAGWLKRKRNQELLRTILAMPFVGHPDKPMMEVLQTYFGIEDPREITNEVALLGAAIAKAIEKGDINAVGILLERAYGKPKEAMPDGDEAPPMIVTNIIQPADMPPIMENEEENEVGATQGDEGIIPESAGPFPE